MSDNGLPEPCVNGEIIQVAQAVATPSRNFLIDLPKAGWILHILPAKQSIRIKQPVTTPQLNRHLLYRLKCFLNRLFLIRVNKAAGGR
jgi:hypothetical protein